MVVKHARRRAIRVHEVLEHLGADRRLLDQLREEGLFEAESIDPNEAEELRVATLLVRDLGVNAAGVHVALHLRRRLVALETRLSTLAGHLRDEADSNRER